MTNSVEEFSARKKVISEILENLEEDGESAAIIRIIENAVIQEVHDTDTNHNFGEKQVRELVVAMLADGWFPLIARPDLVNLESL